MEGPVDVVAIPYGLIIFWAGFVLGMGGVVLGFLAWSGRFERQRPVLERWARRIGYIGLALLAIFAGLFVLDRLLGLLLS